MKIILNMIIMLIKSTLTHMLIIMKIIKIKNRIMIKMLLMRRNLYKKKIRI